MTTHATEKAAPIPADVRATADAIAATWHLLSYLSKVVLSDDIANAIMQDRADRQEERIREDERDRLYAKAREDRDRSWPDPRAWDACEWLSEEGAIHPIDRARLRGDAS